MIDFKAICKELGIENDDRSGNHINGCVTIRCPICGDNPRKLSSKHGNLNPENCGYSCFRCKGASPLMVLTKASGFPMNQVRELMTRYSDGITREKEKLTFAEEIKLPGSKKPHEKHLEYLRKRNLDVDELIEKYDVRFTQWEKWNDVDWSWRIIIPIHDYYGRIISFQGRDILNNPNRNRYMFPPKEKELADSKNIVYGAHLARRRKRIVVVEGIVDAWKLGEGAVATFGCGWKREQLDFLSRWDEVVIAYDYEPDAQKHASELAKELSELGPSVGIAVTELGTNPDGSKRDFGDLTMREAGKIAKDLGL